jgi:hypothetical protein
MYERVDTQELRTEASVSYCCAQRCMACWVGKLNGALQLTVETSLGNEVSETHGEGCEFKGSGYIYGKGVVNARAKVRERRFGRMKLGDGEKLAAPLAQRWGIAVRKGTPANLQRAVCSRTVESDGYVLPLLI